MRRGVAWVMLGGAWMLACGGRYESNPRESDAVGLAGTRASPGGTGTVAGTGGGGSGGVGAASGSGGLLNAACVNQVVAYREYWAELFAQYGSLPCHADSDCRSFYFQSPCDPTCTLLTTAGHRVIVDQLNAYASNCSADCWSSPTVSCPDALPVRCVANHCQ